MGAWDRLIDLHLHGGTAAVVVGSSAGESVTLTDAEQDALLARARRRAAGRMAVIARRRRQRHHCRGCTRAHAVRCRTGRTAGGDPLLQPPHPGRALPPHACARRCVDGAGAALNVPGRTAVDLQPPTVARLAAHPRIVGIKEALGDLARIRELVAAVPGRFAVLSGDDATACEAVLAGARGVISVTANIVPRVGFGRDGGGAARRTGTGHAARSPAAGAAACAGDQPDPIPVKWALAEMHLISPGIRLPLTWLSAAMEPQLRSALAAAGVDAASPQARSA